MPVLENIKLSTGDVITEKWYSDLYEILKGLSEAKGVWYGGYVSSDILPEIDLSLNIGSKTLRFLSIFGGYGYFVHGVFAPNIAGGGVAPTTFLDLTDTPNSYLGQANKVPTVKTTEDGLEFRTVNHNNFPAIKENFLQLNDTPDSYSGEGGKLVAVKSTEDGLEFTSAPAGVSKCLIGFGEAGYIIGAGDYTSHQPFSNSKGSSFGMPVSFSGTAKKLKVQVVSNSLDADCRVIVAKNESETDLVVVIPASQDGLFENNTDTVDFAEGDRIYFIVDTSEASEGDIDIAGITICYEG